MQFLVSGKTWGSWLLDHMYVCVYIYPTNKQMGYQTGTRKLWEMRLYNGRLSRKQRRVLHEEKGMLEKGEGEEDHDDERAEIQVGRITDFGGWADGWISEAPQIWRGSSETCPSWVAPVREVSDSFPGAFLQSMISRRTPSRSQRTMTAWPTTLQTLPGARWRPVLAPPPHDNEARHSLVAAAPRQS